MRLRGAGGGTKITLCISLRDRVGAGCCGTAHRRRSRGVGGGVVYCGVPISALTERCDCLAVNGGPAAPEPCIGHADRNSR